MCHFFFGEIADNPARRYSLPRCIGVRVEWKVRQSAHTPHGHELSLALQGVFDGGQTARYPAFPVLSSQVRQSRILSRALRFRSESPDSSSNLWIHAKSMLRIPGPLLNSQRTNPRVCGLGHATRCGNVPLACGSILFRRLFHLSGLALQRHLALAPAAAVR